MFTGIVEETGHVLESGSRLKIACHSVLEDASIGACIAVNGTCVTAVEMGEEYFVADLSPEEIVGSNNTYVRDYVSAVHRTVFS